MTARTSLTILTQGSRRTFRVCCRKYYFRFILGIDRVQTPEMRVGTAWHAGAALLLSGGTRSEAVELILRSYSRQIEAALTSEYAWSLTYESQAAICMLESWHAHWQDDPLQVVATELQFNLPLFSPQTGRPMRLFRDAGVIDCIVRLRNGRLAIVEHKTTDESVDDASDYWQRIRLDSQISDYIEAARNLDHNVDCVLYDVIRRPRLRPMQIPQRDSAGRKIVLNEAGERVFLEDGKPRQAPDASRGWTLQTRPETPEEFAERLTQDMSERPEHYFNRHQVGRSDDEIDEARLEKWMTAKAIRECELNGAWLRNTEACLRPKCPYLPFCGSRLDASFVIPDGLVKLTDLHPELRRAHDFADSTPSATRSAAAGRDGGSAAARRSHAEGRGSEAPQDSGEGRAAEESGGEPDPVLGPEERAF